MEHTLPLRPNLGTARGRAILHGSRRRGRKVTQRYARLTEPFVGTGQRYIATDEIPDDMDDRYGWNVECIWVAGPYHSRAETYQIDTGALISVNIVNDEGWIHWGRAPSGGTFHHEGVFPLEPRRRRAEKYEFPRHTNETMTLIRPDWILHGYDADWQSATVAHFLGRSATQLTLNRMIPLTDPRVMGDEDNPNVFDLGERVRMTIDDERFVILRAEGLYDGQPWETIEYTELAFDELLDDRLFDLTIKPEFSVVLPAEGSSASSLPADATSIAQLHAQPPSDDQLPQPPVARIELAGRSTPESKVLITAGWDANGHQVQRQFGQHEDLPAALLATSRRITLDVATQETGAPRTLTIFLTREDSASASLGMDQRTTHFSAIADSSHLHSPSPARAPEIPTVLTFSLPDGSDLWRIDVNASWVRGPFDDRSTAFDRIRLSHASWAIRVEITTNGEDHQTSEEGTTR